MNENKQENEMYAIIGDDILSKANIAVEDNSQKINSYFSTHGKSGSELEIIFNEQYNNNTSTYHNIAKEIQGKIVSYFNTAFTAFNAFGVSVEVDDKLDRDACREDAKRKIEIYLQQEQIRKDEKEKAKIDMAKQHAVTMGLPEEQIPVMYGSLEDKNKESKKNISSLKSIDYNRLDAYSDEIIQTFENLTNQSLSQNALNEVLGQKAFFKQYPSIKPADLVDKIKDINENKKREKIKEILQELIIEQEKRNNQL